MSERGIEAFLSDILEAIDRIRDYIHSMDYDSFLADLKTRDAVIRNIEIIGEAAKNVDDDFKESYPVVPWKEMAGVRDILIHHYFGINFEIVWTIISDELPGVRVNIDAILKKLNSKTDDSNADEGKDKGKAPGKNIPTEKKKTKE